MHQMDFNDDIAKLNIKLAQIGYLPNLSLSAYYDVKGTGTQDNSLNPHGQLNFALLLSGTLFNGSATASKVQQAKEKEQVVIQQELALRDSIRQDVEQSLLNIKQGYENIIANQANIDLARETLRMTEARYDAGLATTMDIMDAEVALDQTSNQYYQGVYSYLSAQAQLEMVTGK